MANEQNGSENIIDIDAPTQEEQKVVNDGFIQIGQQDDDAQGEDPTKIVMAQEGLEKEVPQDDTQENVQKEEEKGEEPIE